jgi:hypothetical protein
MSGQYVCMQGMSGRDVMGRGCIVIIRGPFALRLKGMQFGLGGGIFRRVEL